MNRPMSHDCLTHCNNYPKFKFFVKMAPNTKILLQTVNVDLGNKNNEENKVYA